MREIVVISGKGGTGKTSIVASFAAIAGNAVLADCDVDAADLHLLLAPESRRQEEFRSGNEALIRQADCIGCGVCLARCRYGAISRMGGENDVNDYSFFVDPTACEGCGVCVWSCPVKAIDFPERIAGVWCVSDTKYGPMAHARLEPGGENSGKLVSKVKEVARKLAQDQKKDLILVDGPPGIGCPVIASISGASAVLVVTEPTMSGSHDMKRVLQLTKHFNIPAYICVNKYDLNRNMAAQIEDEAVKAGAVAAGLIRYDRSFTDAQIAGRSVIEYQASPAAADIISIWEAIKI